MRALKALQVLKTSCSSSSPIQSLGACARILSASARSRASNLHPKHSGLAKVKAVSRSACSFTIVRSDVGRRQSRRHARRRSRAEVTCRAHPCLSKRVLRRSWPWASCAVRGSAEGLIRLRAAKTPPLNLARVPQRTRGAPGSASRLHDDRRSAPCPAQQLTL